VTVVVITGASSGVGRACARRFAADGADVALIARGEDGLAGAVAEARASGVRALALPLDVADAAAVDAAAERVETELGPIDVWVNCAMATVLQFVWETSAHEYRRATEVSYLGFVHGTLAALRHMRPRDRGVIVQVGSSLSYRAIPLQSAYCAAKFAIRGFTDSLRVELQHDGSDVRITMVQLPGLNTPQFDQVRTTLPRKPRPVAPVWQPDVAADAVAFAAAHPRREVWVGHSTVLTIAGSQLAPRIADRYLARTNVEAQQGDEPIEPDRADYLDTPVPGDRGAHGRFDDESRPRSLQLALSKRKRPLLAAAALALVLLAAGAGSASAEIVPQQSIAGVSIDMSEQDVVGVLGEPGKVHTEYGGSTGEDFFTTYRYGKRGVKVRFLRKRAGNRVTSIEVYKGRRELTATGIGIRSHRDKVKARVAGARCKRYDKWYAVCSVGRGKIGDLQTTFWLNRSDKVKLVTLSRILYD
jgi:NAD(P)-dependent dehydrogenase (short-subunit alcohol dehydrogenase family)